MSDMIPVKLVVKELDHEAEQYLFEQDVIKIGRGRAGKERKGVDVQLSDPGVARVHGVIQVKKLDDVFLMPMGTAATYINGQKVKMRGKLTSGTVMELGTTQITVYLGEDAAHDYLAGGPAPSVAAQRVGDSQGEIPIGSGEYEVVSGDDMGTFATAPATDPGVASADWADAFAEQTAGEGTSPELAPAMAPGTAPGSTGPLFSATHEFSLYPMHAEPEGMFGPMGPTPPPLPERFPESSLEMLLDVADRLGKESWYVQEILW